MGGGWRLCGAGCMRRSARLHSHSPQWQNRQTMCHEKSGRVRFAVIPVCGSYPSMGHTHILVIPICGPYPPARTPFDLASRMRGIRRAEGANPSHKGPVRFIPTARIPLLSPSRDRPFREVSLWRPASSRAGPARSGYKPAGYRSSPIKGASWRRFFFALGRAVTLPGVRYDRSAP
jgi:hypothetical protein